MLNTRIQFFATMLLGVFLAASCSSSKKYIYLKDVTLADSLTLRTAQIEFQNKIQKNDQLSITVGGTNAVDLIALNSGNGLTGGGGGAGANINLGMIGYLVESDGNIKIPFVGKVKAEGLTRIELETKLIELYSDYTKNPIVNVRFLNYGFSVLGEVNRPGRFSMTNERVSILEALSIAGDITSLGKSDNILVVREQNGIREVGRVNLLSKEIFKSPFYYLKSNDVIYIEPVGAKFINRTGIPQYLSIVAVGLSLILTIINLRR